jgi:DNA-binding response OmpR family regulator
MNRILIVEDEARIASFIEKGLNARGFNTIWIQNGKEALDVAINNKFDTIVLDLGLPGKNGLEVLEELRGRGVTSPVIILTARDETIDKVAGLRGGADDYVTKPFSFEELLARIELRMRSNFSPENNDTVLTANNVILDLRTRKVQVNDSFVELSSREFIMAEVFFRHRGQVMSRQQLLDLVWGYDYDPGSNIVDVYVGYLRKKLGSKLIETVRGMGYRLRT